MNDTPDGYNPLSEEKLKERMNFAKMFERQEEQIKQTPHIQNLLIPDEERKRPQTQQDLRSKIIDMEAMLLHKMDQLKAPKRIKFDIQIKNKRHAYFIGALAMSAAIVIGLVAKPETKIEVQEKVIYKEIPAKVKVKYYMTKYVNIRTHARTSAEKITTLAPNSVVEILEEQKDWKKIKYLDHARGKTLIGWAYGENLSPVKLK